MVGAGLNVGAGGKDGVSLFLDLFGGAVGAAEIDGSDVFLTFLDGRVGARDGLSLGATDGAAVAVADGAMLDEGPIEVSSPKDGLCEGLSD